MISVGLLMHPTRSYRPYVQAAGMGGVTSRRHLNRRQSHRPCELHVVHNVGVIGAHVRMHEANLRGFILASYRHSALMILLSPSCSRNYPSFSCMSWVREPLCFTSCAPSSFLTLPIQHAQRLITSRDVSTKCCRVEWLPLSAESLFVS